MTTLAELLQAALQHHEAGRYVEAVELYDRFLREQPDHALALRNLGTILARFGKLELARDLITRALHADPDNPEFLVSLGIVCRALGETGDALACFARAVELRVDHELAQQNLAELLRARGQPDDRFVVSVVTAATGHPGLRRAVDSVQAQSYARLEHLIVIDGYEAETAVASSLEGFQPSRPVRIIQLPMPTGADGYRGHRIYGAAAFLARGQFLLYLDEANWYDPDHVASLVGACTRLGLEWSFSLRRLHLPDGTALANDDCESLGHWPTFDRRHVIDPNCYCLRRDVAMRTAYFWHRRHQDVDNPSVSLCQALIQQHRQFEGTGRYTLNCTLSTEMAEQQRAYFERGNAVMRDRYPEGFPWSRRLP